jgi:hypothetical protein
MRKYSGYKNGPLPPDAFKVLQQQLTSDPVMAFPRSDRKNALITDAATGTAEFSGRLGAILTQIDNNCSQLCHFFCFQTTQRS